MRDTERDRSTGWIGYAAFAWALLFAALTFYWAAGGTAGAHTLSREIREPALRRDGGFVAILWATGVLKVGAALLALAFVRPWGRSVPRWLLLVAGWGTAALLTLYGGIGMTGALLSELGVTESTDPGVVRWYLFLWEPVWLVGGLLFAATAWRHTRRSRPNSTEHRGPVRPTNQEGTRSTAVA